MLLDEFKKLEYYYLNLKSEFSRLERLYAEKYNIKSLESLFIDKDIEETKRKTGKIQDNLEKLITEMTVFFRDLSKAFPQMNLEDVVKIIRSKQTGR